MSVARLMILPLAILLLTGCGSIKPECPDILVNTSDSIPVQPMSYIKVPIKVDLSPYFGETNKSVPVTFSGSDKSCQGVSFSYTFNRAPIQFTGIGNELLFDVDGEYSLELNYCPKCTEVFSSKGNCVIPRIHTTCGVDEPMRKIHVGYTTQIGLTNNYQLTSKTSLRTVKALSPCKITVFNYDATSRLEKEVTDALREVEKDIDKEISSISLKAELQETWNVLSEPVHIEGYGYFLMNPYSMSMSSISYQGNYALFDAVIEAKPAVLTDRPVIFESKVPQLKDFANRDGFEIVMDINATYDSLSHILTNNLKGTRVALKKKEVIFGNIHIFGASDKKLSIQVDFEGSKKGTLYLNGTPVFDSITQTICFPDLTFDIKTKNLLLKSAKWMFDKKITETIRASANMDLQPYLDTLKSELNRTVNMELDKGIYLSGSVNSANICIILPMQDKLFVRARGTGKMKLDM